ncbi:hypothetical protein HHI36_017729 [Cryptolaemus montrouzieri]|uniref:Histone-lysine N-methyltransferase 2C n=1 Tax=Cryptolaemus montrouzieri TaxID=559131 RepID=A0ABD2NND6_9CUCU
MYDFDPNFSDVSMRSMGLGKGKPYSALKLANTKKRLGYSIGGSGLPGRPKGFGKNLPGKVGFMKKQRLNEFGRKRGAKSKMRGMFGFPGVGLQRPTSSGDGKNDEEPGGENRLVLCSAKDKFVLTQDICVMCGALGTDQEGCLIGCVQCGQCYHPYCVNVKVTRVILQKGWRCLDCTVCEGCGERNDEPRLILCDDCDISYHTYCMDPPLDYVPQGTWKCKWCAMCQACGSTDPGFNCTWMNSFTECGPCASHAACASCMEPYNEGDLIIQCVQCDRWLHGLCDSVKTEEEAEKCAEDGYNCLLCRPRDVPPPHLIPTAVPKPPTPTKSPEVKANTNYFMDGIYLSESGHNLIKSLTSEHHTTRKKRKKLPTVQDKEAGILATIESVVAGGSGEGGTMEDNPKIELMDIKDEPQELYKEGMMWTKEDGPPPEGFTIFTMESGVSVLRRKRQRNLQKMGIGGFLVRVRGTRGGQENDDIDILPGQSNLPGIEPSTSMSVGPDGEKPKRKPIRRKPKSKLSETFPAYLQEAFFGKDLLDSTKELASSSSDEEKSTDVDRTIHLSQEEMKAVAAISKKEDKPPSHIMDFKESLSRSTASKLAPLIMKEEEEENTEELKDVLTLPRDLIDNDLVNTIMNEEDDELTRNTGSLDALTRDANLPDDADITDTLGSSGNSKDTKDELSDILGSHFNLDAISNINSKDVEDIFKEVLPDESQESQESNAFPLQSGSLFQSNTSQPVLQHQINQAPIRPTTLPTVQNNLNSPLSFPAQSPYQSEYSNSPQFSPAFSESANTWVSPASDPNEMDASTTSNVSTYNQRSSEKMKADEGLGNGATISAVLYANINHPEWKTEYPNWSDRYKQMIKKWRTLSTEQKAPYLQQARDNRSALRMKKQQQSQTTKETMATAVSSSTSKVAATPQPPTVNIASQLATASVVPVSEDQEKISSQQKSAREAEQERQWKQLQAMRHQQAQQQQHVIHEQRVQGKTIARVQRNIGDANQPFIPELQVNTALQEMSPAASPSPRQFQSLGMKSPSFTHPSSAPALRPTAPSPSHDFSPNTPDSTDPYAQQPSTPKPQNTIFQSRPTGDPFVQQSPARPQFSLPRTAVQGMQPRQETPEINNHLRDLLQRQQFKKLDEQLLAGKGQQRLWPPTESQDAADTPVSSSSSSVDGTFRQPLPPPGITRPRMPTALPNLPRQALVGLRMQPVQNIDTRMRMLMQQQQQVKQRLSLTNQQFQQAAPTVRFAPGASSRPSTVDQYEQILQRQHSLQNKTVEPQTISRPQAIQNPQLAKLPIPQPAATSSLLVSSSAASDQEIPDNVTAELEKLEQETGTMVELQGVSDILGGLGEDDDELLAEMGADFNILEYADPELEALAGEKTNILDLELEEEPLKKEKAAAAATVASRLPAPQPQSAPQPPPVQQQQPVPLTEVKKESVVPPLASSSVTAGTQQQAIIASSSQPPPLALSQQPQKPVHPVQPSAAPLLQQIHQHMIQQVQQAAAQNRPMAPGSRLQTPDGVTGIVTPNNNVQLHVPPNYQRILMSQLQNQKIQMRIGQSLPRILNPTNATVHPSGLPIAAPRLGAPPPPPPPYPGPPPPYPGSSSTLQQQQAQQMGLRMGPFAVHQGGHMHHIPPPLPSFPPQRRPLLLEEQPLLLEDLLEQEKREQEKQSQSHGGNIPSISNAEPALLSDHDFERLKADVFDNNLGLNQPPQQGGITGNTIVTQSPWQQHTQNQRPVPSPTPTPQPVVDIPPRVQLFNVNLLPAPPLPPENIVTEQDKQTQMVYEQWLNHQNNILTQQLRYYETEVQKLRKLRKSLNSKQRQLKKSGNSLTETDATELQRISSEQSILQKHLESSRKQTRQHGMLIQEYRNKQAKQHPGQVTSPHMINQQGQSPLGPPASSPIHHQSTSQSPMMSPSASMSPLTQHNSPLHSPGNLLSHSPGPSSVPNLLQSPSSMAGSGMSPMQPSPRIGTPQSQSDSPVHSPSQICLPPPVPRMTSPQHRRVVTSPVAYSSDIRSGAPQMRFIRTPIDHAATLQQRVVRMASPSAFQQKPGTPSPLNSPPPSQQINITHHILQKQLHQQALMQQQQQQQQSGETNQNESTIAQFQRAAQLMKQRNLLRQQQQQQQQEQQRQQQQVSQQVGQPQPLTPQQHQLMIQQQQQLAKQQQQHIAQLQAQARMNQQNNQPPKSPMPPKSPLVQQQLMSPHSMPPSPMPPRSPMMSYVGNQHQQQSQNQPPHSPIARSPGFHQGMGQPPSSPMPQHHQSPSPVPRSPMMSQIMSPMSMRRPPSTPDMPDRPMSVERPVSVERPMSVENPGTPRTPSYMMDNNQGGGGNPNNPMNPIPAPPTYGRVGYFKLGLRGGSPMWNFGRGAKRVPTPPTSSQNEIKIETTAPQMTRIIKKEPHLNKVSILKKKSAVKLQSSVVGKISSLVSSDYNDLDDSSSTPPVTPPPIASTSRLAKKMIESHQELKEDPQVMVMETSTDNIMDYDDDNSTVLSTEVSLNSAAQNDGDDIAVMETLSQSELTDVMSSPLDSVQISDEYLLFHGNVVDIEGEEQYYDKEGNEEHEYVDEDMHIVIRSPTTSDDEYIMQEKTKKFSMQTISPQLLSITETPESPEQEEINTDPSSEPEEGEMQMFDEPNIVVMKMSEEQISTKEDFEQLIDEGSRKQNILKPSVISVSDINEFHKYASQNYGIQQQKPAIQVIQKSGTVGHARSHTFKQLPQKVSIITTPVIHSVVTSTDGKITTSLQNRSNVLTVPKLVSSGPPVITIVSASSSQMNSMLPTGFTVPVISASAVRQLANVKVIDKPSSSLSLSHDNSLPKKIFEDDSVSPDSSIYEDDKKDSSDEKSKTDSPPLGVTRRPSFSRADESKSETHMNILDMERNRISHSPSPQRNISTVSKEEPKIVSSSLHKETANEPKDFQKNIISEKIKKTPSPIISKTLSPVIIHNTPELKMTAQVIEESQSGIQMTSRTGTDNYEINQSDDVKSVVISIPSPTPSQEQMLDNITLQAIEKRRRDGKGIPSEFESFEDVLDMIENITGEAPTVLEDNIKDKIQETEVETKREPEIREKVTMNLKRDKSIPVVSFSKPSTMPQLSPLSQPTDLTMNMANASQQLRTLLSLHTSASSSSTESIVKCESHKATSSVIISASPVVTSRIIQHIGQPTSTSLNTVIVPNLKTTAISTSINNITKTSHASAIFNAVSNAQTQNVITSGILTPKSISSFHFIPDHSKLTTATILGTSQCAPTICTTPNTIQKTSVISSTTPSPDVKKPSLSLTAMLQSHPAASPTASSSAENITAASLLGTAISLSKSNFNTSLVQAQPNVLLAQANAVSSTSSRMSLNLASTAPPLVPTIRTTTNTNLLHTQLTKVLKKPEVQKPPELIETEDIKQEIKEESFISEIKQEISGGCRNSTIPTPVPINRCEDSQNVLLKKLLQNTGCASTQTMIITSSPSITTSAPVATSAMNLDTQVAKASSTLSSLLPTVKSEPGLIYSSSKPVTSTPKHTLMSRETSFVSSPTVQQSPTSSSTIITSQPLHIDIKKCLPPSRTPSRDDLLSPQTPRSSCSQDSSLQTPPLVMKRELNQLVPQSPILTSHEVKREFMDETSQHSEVSDHSRPDVTVKDETDNLDPEKMLLDQKEELKKQKRRLYQQKRRQNQLQSKEALGQPKKRPRKSSKVEEDYDTYIDSVLAQLRALPSMNVSEPLLNRNFGVVPVFGSGDSTKLGTKEYDSRHGDLKGTYGDAIVPGYLDYYETKPFGDSEPLPEKPPISTQRGFYDKEFPPIKFDNEETKRFDLFCREDSPDSIEGSSSPESHNGDPFSKFVGLRLISDDEDEESDVKCGKGRDSPSTVILMPKPIRLKPSSVVQPKESLEADKENIGMEMCVKSKLGQENTPPSTPLKDSGNVTVTLTLTSSAAENIMGVLRDLANILHIPAPTSYQIVERTTTPPSQKLGLYRTKGKDGKEGAPIDIQSILNGAAKFCKHCDVVILSNMIKKKVSELPFLYKDSELLGDGDDLYFCSTACYMQFALMNRSPSIAEDKAAAIIDHLCQKDRAEMRARNDPFDPKNLVIEKMSVTNEFGRIDDKSLSIFGRQFDSTKPKNNYPMDTNQQLKRWRGVRYKSYTVGCLQPSSRYKKPTDKETMELLYKLGVTLTSPKGVEDTRRCMFCQAIGDGVADGPGRLLNYDVDKWVHLNCALWSEGVYETVNGALMNLENALRQSLVSTCIHCHHLGATVRCFKTRCSSVYHLNCAVKDNCVFFKNKTTYCTPHVPKNEKDNELTTLSVSRRVYINRDENRQVAAVMHHSDNNNLLRVGNLIFLNVGQLLPHQLQNFHNANYIYPIGYKIVRFYWSMRRLNKRCRYVCSIQEAFGRPEFKVLVQEPPDDDIEFKDSTPKAIWARIVDQLAALRRENQCVKTFSKFVNGEDLFGLTEPAVVRVLESLPGIETLTDYKFKYGRNPLLELPLAINPSGSARTEPRLKNQQHWKRHHTQRSGGSSLRPLFGPTPPGPSLSTFSEAACPYSKQFVHSKSSQYKKMKMEWRNNVFLARSKIQGLGLYSARDLEKHTMVIEYIGEIIRTELAETREKKYEARNRGIYMFRLDEERVVDATLSGGLARYINHSCNPNCVAETVEVDRDLRIIIFAKRRIQRGEELSYDYKFDIEDDQHKISCMCGAPNCRKWMN